MPCRLQSAAATVLTNDTMKRTYEIDPQVKQRKPLPIPVKEWKRRARVVLEWLATPDDQSDAEEIARQTDAMVEEARKLTSHGPEQP